jgi:hypothetical protein
LRSVQEQDLVTTPAVQLPSRRRLGLPAIAIAAACALALTGTLAMPTRATHPRASAPSANTDSLIAGAQLQSARCSNWLRASAADKALAIRALAYSVGGPTEYKGVRGTTLTTAEGYQLLDNACASPIARHFLLYELYIRAAGFRSLWANGQP